MAKRKKSDLIWKIFVGVMLLSLLLSPILVLLSVLIGGNATA